MEHLSENNLPTRVSATEAAFCQANNIPLPTQAPEERMRELLAFYNSIFLYNNTCALTGKSMLSIVPPNKNFKVYDIGVWMDDTAWDPMQYGRDYDFTRPFFEQFADLMREVPIPSRSVVLSTMENSDYTNGVSNVKNCYLIFDCNMCEDCYFCYQMNNGKNIVDSVDVNNNENCTGNFLYECKNCQNTYFSSQAEDCEWSTRANKSKNCIMYAIFGLNAELIYNSVVCGNNVYNLKFCYGCFVNARDLEYCMHVGFGSSDCFGSIGLRKKQYCILNKQYSKEDYFELVSHIKTHMLSTGEYGKFFPKEFSSFFYNKSEAASFLPLAKTEALQKGYTWEDEVIEDVTVTYNIPDNIKDVTDEILSQTLKCEQTGKKYRVIKQELDLYRRWQVPIPRTAPLERLKLACQNLNLPSIHQSNCANCNKEITTGYVGTEPKVFCEDCYQKSML